MKNIIIAIVLTAVIFFAYRACSSSAPKQIKNRVNSGNVIIAFGDSLTYGYGSTAGNDYPSLLGQKVNMRVINMGVNGDTAPSGYARIREIDSYRPYMVLIEFGGNDYMKQVPISETESAMRSMVDYVQSKGAIAVIVDTGGNPFMGKYTDMYKQIAKEKEAVFVPAIMKNILTDRKLKSDQIHPNDAGYAIVAERVFKGIEPYLKK
ncbi:Lysophospholipase L1 [Parelusimicrobium proximum]|uniref:GDSL-type esterase/lipase family protein n=1 Tax=Parelusimicrobium proximum TaxID=3228953 RepID=UPI003D183B39